MPLGASFFGWLHFVGFRVESEDLAKLAGTENHAEHP